MMQLVLIVNFMIIFWILFFQIQELVSPTYIPTTDDILHARVRTSGIVEENYIINEVEFIIIDVGGQRNERKKWMHCFEVIWKERETRELRLSLSVTVSHCVGCECDNLRGSIIRVWSAVVWGWISEQDDRSLNTLHSNCNLSLASEGRCHPLPQQKGPFYGEDWQEEDRWGERVWGLHRKWVWLWWWGWLLFE